MVPSRERVQFINFSKSFNRPSGPFHIKCVRNRVRVGDGYSEEFGIGVGSARFCSLATSIYGHARGFIQGVLQGLSMEDTVYKLPNDYCRVP